MLVASFAMAMESISTATASVGFASLCAVGILRAGVLWPIWCSMWREAWVKLLLVWIAWSALSIAWSPDPITGLDRLWNLKFLLWIPLLWPLHRHWAWLLGSFLFATLVLQGVQASGVFFDVRKKGMLVMAGMRHPTMAGMWDAIALSCWLFLSVVSGWRMALLSLPMAVLCAFGFFWAGQRAALVGLLAEIAVANALLAVVAAGWVKRALIRGTIGLAILLVVYSASGKQLVTKINQAAKEASQSLSGDTPVIMEARMALWTMSLEAWRASPVVGRGLGGYADATKSIVVPFKDATLHEFTTPHSTYVTILTECGLVGLGLFVLWAIVFFGRAIAMLRDDPVRIGAIGGAIVWFTAAAFDSFNTRGVFLTVGAIMIALSVMPHRETRLR